MQTLKNKIEFSTVFDGTELKLVNHHFVVLIRHNSLTYPRLGVVVQKKRARRSVDRNFLKRIIKSTFSECVADSLGVDVVILTRQSSEISVALKHRKVLRQSLCTVWKRLNRKLQ